MSSPSITENALLALSQSLADTVERVGGSIVAVNTRRSASGIHWRKGIIVTSDESIGKDENITVTLPSGRTVPVTIVGRDPSTDVAVLRFTKSEEAPSSYGGVSLTDAELPIAEVGTNTSLQVGHLVLAVGRGQGLTASMGVVSTVGDAWRSFSGGLIDQFIRLDLNLYPGCAGGALVEAMGGVVGFNTYGPRRSVLAIPAATVNRVVDQLLEKGRIARGYLGVGMQPVHLPQSLTDRLSLSSRQGIIVVSLEPQGPADRAGLLLGDVLVALNGTPVTEIDEVQRFLGTQSVGQTLRVQLIRGGELVELDVVVGERR